MNTGRSPQRRAAPSPCALFGERRDDERVARAGERVDRRVRSLAHLREQANARRGAAIHRRARPQVLHDHGPRRGRPLGRADALPAHAVHRRLLPAGRRLPARRRPAQGQHARARLLRRGGPQEGQAHHPVAPHALRPQGRPGEDVQVGPRLGHLHGGLDGRRPAEDPRRILPAHGRRGRRARRGDAARGGRPEEPVPRLRAARGLRGARRDVRGRRRDVRERRRRARRLHRGRPVGGGPQGRPRGRRRRAPGARARAL
mmetsp:Transcript_25294/g.65728  ORF Transcript_25294/g.65728 Transcript_25294/m.65728 type:complete len:259 (-) Transcript_25294:23-799(-)